jgi:hypothetical protein
VIALCTAGGVVPTAWSGTPYGVVTGLSGYGVTVRPVRGAGGPLLGPLVRRSQNWRVRTGAEKLARTAQLRRADVQGVLQLDSRAVVSTRVPLVMYEDMTVRQAISVGAKWIVSRPRADLEAWIGRQSRLYANAAAVCAMSPWTADSVVEDYGVSPGKVHVVGAGANHVVRNPAERDWSIPRFLFVGKGFNRKNGPAVLRAFAELRMTHSEARLDVVGGHPDLDGEGVVGHGQLSLADPADRARIEELYAHATCFVLPSQLEPFGIACLEAATAGIPSIAGNIGGTFVDDTCGRLVDPYDDDAILSAMHELADPATARSLGAIAGERARLYTWPLVAGRILRCFAEALGKPVDGLPAFLPVNAGEHWNPRGTT